MTNFKFVKSATAYVLGASVLTIAVGVPGVDASAKITYSVTSKGILVNEKTNKAVKGYKSYKGKLYKDGKKLTGLYNKKYYFENGVKATGIYKDAYYYKGVKKVTTGLYKGYYYKKGVKATGTYKGAYYVKGVKKVTTGLYEGKYYKNGVLNVGLALFEGKYYLNATLANGPIKDANGVLKSYKEGLIVTYTANRVPTVYVLGNYTLASAAKDSKYTSDEPVVLASTKAEKTTLDKAKGEYTITATPTLNAAFFKENGKDITEKTVNRIVTITETGEKISVPVTYSIDPSKVWKVEVFRSGTKEPTSKVKVIDKVTKAYSLSDLLRAADFKTTDQYGVQSVPLIDADKVTFTTVSGSAQFSNNSSKFATVDSATAGSIVKATVTKDGKTVTVEITFDITFAIGGANGGEGDIKVVSPKEFNGTSDKAKVFKGNIKVDITGFSKLENAVINGNLVLTGTASKITFSNIKVNGQLDVSGVKGSNGSNISFEGIEVEEATL